MERLPQYWAVRNNSSIAFKDSVVKYLRNQNVVPPSSFNDGFCGRSSHGYFFNMLPNELQQRKEIVVLPLHLFETLVENETKPKSLRKSVNLVANSEILVGYTLKAGVSNEVALRALGISESSPMFRNRPSLPLTFELNTNLHGRAVDAGILDLLFNPIYKQKASDVIVRHSTGHLIAHINDDIVTIDGLKFTISDVQRILAPINGNGINFIPTTFTTGCNNQYVGISRKDIEQVLDQMLPF